MTWYFFFLNISTASAPSLATSNVMLIWRRKLLIMVLLVILSDASWFSGPFYAVRMAKYYPQPTKNWRTGINQRHPTASWDGEGRFQLVGEAGETRQKAAALLPVLKTARFPFGPGFRLQKDELRKEVVQVHRVSSLPTYGEVVGPFGGKLDPLEA